MIEKKKDIYWICIQSDTRYINLIYLKKHTLCKARVHATYDRSNKQLESMNICRKEMFGNILRYYLSIKMKFLKENRSAKKNKAQISDIKIINEKSKLIMEGTEKSVDISFI